MPWFSGDLCLDSRPAIRKSACHTLLQTSTTHGNTLDANSWQHMLTNVSQKNSRNIFIAVGSVATGPNTVTQLLPLSGRPTFLLRIILREFMIISQGLPFDTWYIYWLFVSFQRFTRENHKWGMFFVLCRCYSQCLPQWPVNCTQPPPPDMSQLTQMGHRHTHTLRICSFIILEIQPGCSFFFLIGKT